MFFWAALTCSAVLGFRLRPSRPFIALFLDLLSQLNCWPWHPLTRWMLTMMVWSPERSPWLAKNGRRAAEKLEISFHGSAAFRRFANMVYSKDIFSVDTIEKILLSTFIVLLSSTYSCTSEFNIGALFFVRLLCFSTKASLSCTQVHGRPRSKHLGTRNELWCSHSHAYQLHHGAYHHATRCCIWSTEHHGPHGCYADLCRASHDGHAYYAGTCDLCRTHGTRAACHLCRTHGTRAACDLCCTHDTGATSDICGTHDTGATSDICGTHDTGATSDICGTRSTGTNLCSDARASCDLAVLCTYSRCLFQSRVQIIFCKDWEHQWPTFMIFPFHLLLGLLLWNTIHNSCAKPNSSCEVDHVDQSDMAPGGALDLCNSPRLIFFHTACVWGKLWGSFSYPYHGLTWGHSWDCCAWAYWCDCEYGGHHRHRSDHQHHGTATQETYTDHDGHYNSSEDLRGGCEGFWEGYDKHCKFVKLVEPPVLRTLIFKPWVFPSLFIIFDHFAL